MMSCLNIIICGFHYNNKTKSLRISFSSKYHVKKNIKDNKCVPDNVNDDMITTVESIHADTDGRYSEHHLVMLRKFQT